MNASEDGERARQRQIAEQRLIVQATLQAKRAGKLAGARPSSSSEAVTAVVVLVVVVATLALAIRYGG